MNILCYIFGHRMQSETVDISGPIRCIRWCCDHREEEGYAFIKKAFRYREYEYRHIDDQYVDDKNSKNRRKL